jgi:hypothetical protein
VQVIINERDLTKSNAIDPIFHTLEDSKMVINIGQFIAVPVFVNGNVAFAIQLNYKETKNDQGTPEQLNFNRFDENLLEIYSHYISSYFIQIFDHWRCEEALRINKEIIKFGNRLNSYQGKQGEKPYGNCIPR